MSKDKVIEQLQIETEKLKEVVASGALTTEAISSAIGIQRNTTSQYLNELIKEDLAIKVKTRPAYYFDKAVFAEKFFPTSKSVYNRFENLKKEAEFLANNKKDPVFDALIGADSSLRTAIDQIKAAVRYPGVGLPMLFHGETGVGKSMLAKTTYEFCVEQQLLPANAPFLELNCAQYYHNQELLSSILFGYKKGSFTGATNDGVGLLEACDGGILFLDECHRLSPESQEKLFTFMDKGTYQRIGENNIERHSHVRIIFATTEDINNNFLRTFIRRIPIVVNIPAMKERSHQEKVEYVYSFFLEESKKLGKELIISPWILTRLTLMNYQDNVGELKNLIKIICAGAFSKQQESKQVKVTISSLEARLLSRFMQVKEISSYEGKEICITPTSQLSEFVQSTNSDTSLINDIYKVFQRLFEQLNKEEVTEDYLIQQSSREAATVIEMMVFKDGEQQDNALKLLHTTIQELVNFLESSFYIKISGNAITALTNDLYKRNNFSAVFSFIDPTFLSELTQFTETRLTTENKILDALIELFETKLDISLMDFEKALLIFYLHSLDLQIKRPEVHGLILAHGFSTASSIADVVNRFLEEHIFDAFDMPFNVSLDKVKEYLQFYLKNNDCQKGLVVLVDMGSLVDLADNLEDQVTGPMLVIDNVTTQQALFVGDMLTHKEKLEEIGKKISEGLQIQYQVTYPKVVKKPLIITVCHTGLGAAQQLKEFLQSSLPDKIDYQVEAVDYHYLKKYGTENSLFSQYDVEGIIGTVDPKIEGIPYVSLEDLISGEGQLYIEQIFTQVHEASIRKEINDSLIRNLSIERLISAITILDVQKVISYIDTMLEELEKKLTIQLSNSKRAILYVHIAGLVERSIRNMEVSEYHNDEVVGNRQKEIRIISESFKEIESAYSIRISDYELNYLYDIIYDI